MFLWMYVIEDMPSMHHTQSYVYEIRIYTNLCGCDRKQIEWTMGTNGKHNVYPFSRGQYTVVVSLNKLYSYVPKRTLFCCSLCKKNSIFLYVYRVVLRWDTNNFLSGWQNTYNKNDKFFPHIPKDYIEIMIKIICNRPIELSTQEAYKSHNINSINQLNNNIVVKSFSYIYHL